LPPPIEMPVGIECQGLRGNHHALPKRSQNFRWNLGSVHGLAEFRAGDDAHRRAE
jgi:hypothetical protein